MILVSIDPVSSAHHTCDVPTRVVAEPSMNEEDAYRASQCRVRGGELPHIQHMMMHVVNYFKRMFFCFFHTFRHMLVGPKKTETRTTQVPRGPGTCVGSMSILIISTHPAPASLSMLAGAWLR